MGNRANIVILPDTEREAPVVFYTHWRGFTGTSRAVREALTAAPGRWSDSPYMARMIFCRLVPQDEWMNETGFGISTAIGDNENPILVVDFRDRTVAAVGDKEPHYNSTHGWRQLAAKTSQLSFAQFVNDPSITLGNDE